jgi:hypothetical protein
VAGICWRLIIYVASTGRSRPWWISCVSFSR